MEAPICAEKDIRYTRRYQLGFISDPGWDRWEGLPGPCHLWFLGGGGDLPFAHRMSLVVYSPVELNAELCVVICDVDLGTLIVLWFAPVMCCCGVRLWCASVVRCCAGVIVLCGTPPKKTLFHKTALRPVLQSVL